MRNVKVKHIKSAAPVYIAAGTWLLMGLILRGNILKIWGVILTAALSIGAYYASSRVFRGQDIEVEEVVSTGDAEIDRQIAESRERLKKLQEYNDQLPDPVISEQLTRMKNAGDAILDTVEKDPSKAGEVRRFMSYFLPTAEKLVASYVTFDQAKTKTQNVRSAMHTVEESLGKIADAFERQLDSLLQARTFDIEADASVLKTLLAGEGLIDSLDLNTSVPKAPELTLENKDGQQQAATGQQQ